MNPIEIHQLTKTFRGRRGRQVEALRNLTLRVGEAEVVGFLGPNGAGKSTTIKTLMGQIRPTSGTALLFGELTGAAHARLQVGYLPENPAFYSFLTAREYLDLVGRTFVMGRAAILRESQRVLELLDLTEAANRPIRGYSKGMVQRLGLAQALLHDPALYILDEPMSGLDPVGRALVKDLMLDLKRQGKTVFFSTHVIADVEAVCDRVAIVAKGELRAESTVNEIMTAGIDGYVVRLAQAPPLELREYLSSYATAAETDLYVPCHQLDLFLRQLDRTNCSIQMIEPRRRSLEDFFLKIIA